MIEISKNFDCCGCEGCVNICPNNSITLVVDNEGFYYPKIEKDQCLNCGLCDKVCPTKNELNLKKEKVQSYACINKNEISRLSSSSGGIFELLYTYVIGENGVVFGAAFDDEFKLVHTYGESLEMCEKFKGSKYVQSKIGNTFSKAKHFLDQGRLVLFSGTQCEIKGLNLFLGKKYHNLVTVDVICHGVPSQIIFDKYKKNLEEEYNSRIVKIEFRDKSRGWHKFSASAKFENGRKYTKTLNEDIYIRGFLKNLYLRPSCYNCKSKDFSSGSDISLGDFWGIKDNHPYFDDDKGVSLVIVNNLIGKEIFNKINKYMVAIETNLDGVLAYNPCIVESVKCNPRRKKFFQSLQNKNIRKHIEEFIKPKFGEKVKRKIKYELEKLNCNKNIL